MSAMHTSSGSNPTLERFHTHKVNLRKCELKIHIIENNNLVLAFNKKHFTAFTSNLELASFTKRFQTVLNIRSKQDKQEQHKPFIVLD